MISTEGRTIERTVCISHGSETSLGTLYIYRGVNEWSAVLEDHSEPNEDLWLTVARDERPLAATTSLLSAWSMKSGTTASSISSSRRRARCPTPSPRKDSIRT
ncbi:hypothetical protein [Microvirga ossetica]|uniref:hypothetical protein n=1 Tax=Microvirga ossetica TaxID=1882682 RepID=UPI0013001010|nr:hypothetical protein [Microvirga ossetica]